MAQEKYVEKKLVSEGGKVKGGQLREIKGYEVMES